MSLAGISRTAFPKDDLLNGKTEKSLLVLQVVLQHKVELLLDSDQRDQPILGRRDCAVLVDCELHWSCSLPNDGCQRVSHATAYLMYA
jgi:hypothetical protein